MAPNLQPGAFKIVSLVEGRPPVGVNPTRPASQEVHLNAKVLRWEIRAEGKDTYRLSVGGYAYTGERDGRVIATIHPHANVEWRAIYQRLQDAYIIEPVHGGGKGWTVPFNALSNPGPDSHAVIELHHIIMMPSEPPMFSTAQLFRFQPLHRD